MAAITTCRNWTAMHNSAPVGPPSRSRAIRWSLFEMRDRKSTRLNSSHGYISYAVFCLKKKKTHHIRLVLQHLYTDYMPLALHYTLPVTPADTDNRKSTDSQSSARHITVLSHHERP